MSKETSPEAQKREIEALQSLPERPKRVHDPVHDKLKAALTRRGIPWGHFNRRPKRRVT
jgi:hypothetical protein